MVTRCRPASASVSIVGSNSIRRVGRSGTPKVGYQALPCLDSVANMTRDDGVPGASARREYERRRAKDEASTRSKWGLLGGAAVALSSERQSTSAWSAGARGEERVGAALDRLRSATIQILHDRRIPGTRANVDHLVVTPGGIWVVDAKKYKGRPQLRVEGGLFRAREEHLFVSSRNKTALVEGVKWQMARVLEHFVDVPVRGVLCFVDADWPILGEAFTVNGVGVMWPKRLMSTVAGASAQVVDVPSVASKLASAFPAA